MRGGGVDWVQLAQDMDQRWDLVKVEMKLPSSMRRGQFLGIILLDLLITTLQSSVWFSPEVTYIRPHQTEVGLTTLSLDFSPI
jgi:hypothetical protein